MFNLFVTVPETAIVGKIVALNFFKNHKKSKQNP